MAGMMPILQAVLIPFSIVAIGYILRRIRGMKPEPLAEVAMVVAAPCLIFSVLTHSEMSGDDVKWIVISAVGIVVLSGVFGWLILRATRIPSRGLYLPIMFMNAVNIPFPIVLFLWGPEGMARAVIFYIVVVALLFTVGIAIAAGRAAWKRTLTEPVLWATVAAFVVKGSGLDLPDSLDQGITLLGGAAIPLVLLALGMQLADTRLDSIREATVVAATRAVGGLLLGIAFAYVLNLEGLTRSIVILYSAMPPAMINAAIALRFNSDPERVSAAVLIGTIASLFYLPLVIRFLV